MNQQKFRPTKLSLLTCFFAITCISVCAAEEIKIVDRQGLTRAVGNFKLQADVTVELRGPATSVKLHKLDGIAPVLDAKKIDANSYKFSTVPGGLWELRTEPEQELGPVRASESAQR